MCVCVCALPGAGLPPSYHWPTVRGPDGAGFWPHPHAGPAALPDADLRETQKETESDRERKADIQGENIDIYKYAYRVEWIPTDNLKFAILQREREKERDCLQ